ncbi:thioredoxin [Spiroplasma endosymbiont of Labia minor]|uniref:thioredoxin n=1 Tax=Spiroplasma endosymbiont of Labia minor TaxID=3066305 RepID=UPI0030CCEF13
MSIKKIKTVEEYDLVLNSGKHIFVDFSAVWCGPCKMLEPFLEELSEEETDVTFLNVDVDELPKLMERYEIMSIPTLIIFKDGVQVNKHIGFAPKIKLKELVA